MEDPRNVFVHNEGGDTIFSFFHNGSISNSYFYDMLRIPFRFGTSIRLALRTANGPPVIVPPDNQPLAQGHYVFVDEDNNVVEPEIGEEPSEARLVTPGSAEPRISSFSRLVRARDGKCVITGLPFETGYTASLNAVHIFPHALEELWVKKGFRSWVDGEDPPTPGSGIDSPKNGLLMESGIHAAFAQYSFAIDPRNNYKIVCFRRDHYHIDGKQLDPVCRTTGVSNRVSDQALQWHYHQAVLQRMRAAAEPRDWEYDNDRTGDILGRIRADPRAALRMEMELATRLGSVGYWPKAEEQYAR